MSRHSRRSSPAYSRTPKPWLWLSAGLLLGGLLTLLASPQNWNFQTKKKEIEEKTTTTVQKSQSAGRSQTTPPRFEFYTLLPEMEEAMPVIPQPPPTQQPSKPTPQNEPSAESAPPQAPPLKTAPGSSEVYVLQAGSFRSYTQADKRKADLALMGIEATIQTVTIDGSQTWHRVRIGPSTNLSKLYRIRQQLHENQIESQLFKVKS